MLKISSLLPALAAFTVTLAAAAGNYGLIGQPDVKFTATGPGGLKIAGKGDTMSVADDGKKLTVKASVRNLKTGIGLRDSHCKKYIGAEKNPDSKLEVERSALQFPEEKKTNSGSATGKFTLNGVTKDQKFDYTAHRTGSDLHVTGKMIVDITRYGIEKPCYLGVCTATDVLVEVKFKLREK